MKQFKLGINTSPLYDASSVRGIGFYTKKLLEGLEKFDEIKVVKLENREEVNKGNYNLLHIPYFNPYFFTLPWRKKTPVVLTIHDLVPVKYSDHYPPGLKGKICWEMQKKMLKKVDLIVTDSFASKYDIAKFTGYPQDRIYVIYLAPDESFKKLEMSKACFLEIKKKYSLPDTFVLYVGDVNWNKNIPGLIKACRIARVPLVIAGKQAVSENFDKTHPENKDLVWLRNYFENCKLRIGNSKFLNLVGFVPQKDLIALYNLASVYCQPSFDEGFGLPPMEAMACGCPVVASKRGSLPEVLADAALMVEPNEKDLAEGIRSILDSRKLREKITSLGFNRVKEFSWKKTIRETVSVYKLLLST